MSFAIFVFSKLSLHFPFSLRFSPFDLKTPSPSFPLLSPLFYSSILTGSRLVAHAGKIILNIQTHPRQPLLKTNNPAMAPPIPSSNSLWSPLDTVKDAAELLGIANLPNEVANVLAMDVEYRVFQITEQALKFMRHLKRKTLRTRDISKALKSLNVEPLYGYNIADRPLSFKQALVGPGQALFYVDESQVDFEKLINAPLPKIPRRVTFTAHWLAIEGVQPDIPQNPSPAEIRALDPSQRGALKRTENAPLPVRPLIKHVISKELQLYFNRIVEVLSGDDEALRGAALLSLRLDPGLHQLVPYLVQFVLETVTNNLSEVLRLQVMLEAIYSLLLNKHVFLDPYVHALLPCVLTLLLARKVGKVPIGGTIPEDTEARLDEALAVREFAASLLEYILKHYGSNYNTLRPRVARTLLKAFLQPGGHKGADKSLIRNFGLYYGAVIGITKLGPEVVRLVLLGNLKVWSETVFAEDDSEKNEVVSGLLNKQKLLLEKAVVNALKGLKQDNELAQPVEREKLRAKIGDKFATLLEQEDDFEDIVAGILTV